MKCLNNLLTYMLFTVCLPKKINFRHRVKSTVVDFDIRFYENFMFDRSNKI